MLSDGFWILIDQNEVPNMAVLEHQPHARNRAKKEGRGGGRNVMGPRCDQDGGGEGASSRIKK